MRTILLLTAFVFMAACQAAYATDCPPASKSCKVVVISTEEMRSLDAIFEAAAYANRMQMDPLTKAWKDKINQSPDGTVKAEPKPEPKAK